MTRAGRLRLVVLAAAVVVIAALATYVRFAQLDSQPGGLFMDEGAEGLSALRILHVHGYLPMWFQDDGGREPLYAYLVAAAFRAFGETVTVLRGVSAALGVLGVLAAFLMLRRFGALAALCGMAWAAGSLWLICVDRDGFRNALVPLAGALAIWALARWADHPADRGRAILAGAVCGAGLWTYQPLKLTPLLVPLWLAHLQRQARLEGTGPATALWDGMRATLRAAVVAYVVVALPMLAVAVFDPGSYFGRAAEVSPYTGPLLLSLPRHILRTLGMFALTGDSNARHDVASLPLLGWPLTLVAAAGAWRAWRLRSPERGTAAWDPAASLVLIGLPLFLLPPLLAVEGGAPHFLRSLGLAPIVAALVGLGCLELVERAAALARGAPAVRLAAAGACLLGLAVLGAASWRAYSTRPVSARYYAYAGDLVALAHAARPGDVVLIDDYEAFVIDFVDHDAPPTVVDPTRAHADPVPGQPVLFLASDRRRLAYRFDRRAADAAVPVAWDPAGRPAVFRAIPSP